VIEFNQRTDGDAASPIVLNVEAIQTMEPEAGMTRIALKNGRTVVAKLPYNVVRGMVLAASSEFVTAL